MLDCFTRIKSVLDFFTRINTKHVTCNSPKQEQAPGIQYLIHDNRGKAGDVHISDPQKKKENNNFLGGLARYFGEHSYKVLSQQTE